MLKKMVILPALGCVTTLAVSCAAEPAVSKEDTKAERQALLERVKKLEQELTNLGQNHTRLLEEIEDLNRKIKQLEENYFGAKNEVRIISKTLNGQQEMDEIYQIQPGQKMFSDLLLWINEFEVEQKIVEEPRFGFRPIHAEYGLFVNRVNGVLADYGDESNTWWRILSPTFDSKFTANPSPLAYRRNFDLAKFSENDVNPWGVNKGISSLPLIGRQILVFWQSPS